MNKYGSIMPQHSGFSVLKKRLALICLLLYPLALAVAIVQFAPQMTDRATSQQKEKSQPVASQATDRATSQREENLDEQLSRCTICDRDGQVLGSRAYALPNFQAPEPAYRLRLQASFSPLLSRPEITNVAGPGDKVRLTIDSYVQFIAEKALQKALAGDFEIVYPRFFKKGYAKGGVCVVMDAKSGEVLAMATASDSSSEEKPRNRAVCDAYEPYNLLNVFTAAAALKNGATPNTIYDAPTFKKVEGRPVVPLEEGLAVSDRRDNLSRIIQLSSKPGASNIALGLGKEKLAKALDDFGFGHATGIGWPGESEGFIGDYHDWSEYDTCTRSFGRDCTATPIQLVSAMQAVANAGVRMQPRIIKSTVDKNGKVIEEFPHKELNRPISAENAKDLTEILCKVVEGDGVSGKGLGAPATIPGIRAAGKPGTVKVVEQAHGGGCVKDHYTASFLGFAPADDPRIVVLVKLEDIAPGSMTDYSVAGPTWSYVCTRALYYLREVDLRATQFVSRSQMESLLSRAVDHPTH